MVPSLPRSETDEILCQRHTGNLRRARPIVEVLLHNVRSLYNVGAFFRTADAVGLSRLHLSGFTPHVTLLYDRQSVPESGIGEPITWMVGEFVLVRSLYGLSEHVHCARWPLRG